MINSTTVLFFTVLGVSCALAQSQPLAAGPSEGKGQLPQQKAAPKQDGPEGSRNTTGTFVPEQGYAPETKQSAQSELSKWSDPITIFTGFLVFIGLLQWRTYQNALKTNRAQLRAYLSIEVDSDTRVWKDMQTRIIFWCVNHGSTPAKNVIWRGCVVELMEGQQLPKIEGQWEGKNRTIFPNGNVEEPGAFRYYSGEIFTEIQISKCLLEKRRYAVGMEVHYVDVFMRKQQTREWFYVTSERDGRSFERINGGSFVS